MHHICGPEIERRTDPCTRRCIRLPTLMHRLPIRRRRPLVFLCSRANPANVTDYYLFFLHLCAAFILRVPSNLTVCAPFYTNDTNRCDRVQWPTASMQPDENYSPIHNQIPVH